MTTAVFPKISCTSWDDVKRTIFEWKPVVTTIAKIALAILFPIVSVIVGSCLLPVTWAPIALPTIAIGTIAAAYLNFEMPVSVKSQTYKKQTLPVGAPRGINNSAGNCWVNTLVQMLHAEPHTKAWLLSDECPPELLPFKKFLKAYDLAIAKGLNIVPANSQALRECLVMLAQDIQVGHARQEDPTEGWLMIHDKMPKRLKSEMRLICRYDPASDQPQLDNTSILSDKILAPVSHLSVAITEDHPTLETLLHTHCNVHGIRTDVNAVTDEGTMHRYNQIEFTESMRFLSAPPSLWVDFQRTAENIKTDIEIPDVYYVTLENGAKVPYQLTSFANHLGNSGKSGHYISIRRGPGDGKWYKISDRTVTEASDEELYGTLRKQAYFVNYTRVNYTSAD
jgi:hypothetical protein